MHDNFRCENTSMFRQWLESMTSLYCESTRTELKHWLFSVGLISYLLILYSFLLSLAYSLFQAPSCLSLEDYSLALTSLPPPALHIGFMLPSSPSDPLTASKVISLLVFLTLLLWSKLFLEFSNWSGEGWGGHPPTWATACYPNTLLGYKDLNSFKLCIGPYNVS